MYYCRYGTQCILALEPVQCRFGKRGMHKLVYSSCTANIYFNNNSSIYHKIVSKTWYSRRISARCLLTLNFATFLTNAIATASQDDACIRNNHHIDMHALAADEGGVAGTPLQKPVDFEQWTELAIALCRRRLHALRQHLSQLHSKNVDEATCIMKQDPLFALRAVDDISDAICTVTDAAECFRNVHSDESWRSAASASWMRLYELLIEMNHDPALFMALQYILTNADTLSHMTSAQRHTAQLLLLDFERQGAYLSKGDQQKFAHLLTQIADLSTLYQQNMTSERIIDISTLRSKGIDYTFANNVLSMKNPNSLLLNSYTMDTVLSNFSDEASRRTLWYAFQQASEPDSSTLAELVRCRHELANLLGYKTFSAMILSQSIVGSDASVLQFLRSELNDAKKSAQTHASKLNALKMADIITLKAESKLFHAWDWKFYIRKLALEVSNTANCINDYFSVGNLLAGFQTVCKETLGLDITFADLKAREAWFCRPEFLSALHVKQNGLLLGTIYLDLFTRPHKTTAPSCYILRCGKQLHTKKGSVYQVPRIMLVTSIDATSIDWKKIGMDYSTAETLWHELGHALHHCVGRTEFQHVSGTRGQLDFAEIPSKLFEHFMRDYCVVSRWAKHRLTAEVLPRELFDAAVLDAHRFDSLNRLIYLMQSYFDVMLYDRVCDTPGKIAQLAHDIWREFSVTEPTFGDTWYLRHPHLVHYECGYWVYAWCDRIAELFWDKHLSMLPLSSESGAAVMALLKPGFSEDPRALLNRLLDIDIVHDTLAKV